MKKKVKKNIIVPFSFEYNPESQEFKDSFQNFKEMFLHEDTSYMSEDDKLDFLRRQSIISPFISRKPCRWQDIIKNTSNKLGPLRKSLNDPVTLLTSWLTS